MSIHPCSKCTELTDAEWAKIRATTKPTNAMKCEEHQVVMSNEQKDSAASEGVPERIWLLKNDDGTFDDCWQMSTIEGHGDIEYARVSPSVDEADNASPRLWTVEYHDARGDYVRVCLVSRNSRFETGYYVVAADDMEIRREQAIRDFKFIANAVNRASSPVDEAAVRRAAEKIVEFTFDEYPDNDMKRGQLITHATELASDSGRVDEVAKALEELREMFPRGGTVSISTQQPPEFGITVFTPTGIVFQGATLSEAMAKVREFHAEGMRAKNDAHRDAQGQY